MDKMNIKKSLQNKYYPKELIPHLMHTCDCESAKRVLEVNKRIRENIKRNNGQLIGRITA